MPFTSSSALTKAALTKAALAASRLRLFKSSFVPDVNSTLGDFDDNEADYAGYPANGLAITAFLGPLLNPNGGADVISPLQLFLWNGADGDPTNLIGGWYLVTAAATAPLLAEALWAYTQFTVAVGMAKVGDAIPLVISLTEGQNPAP